MTSDHLPQLLRNLRYWREAWQNDGLDVIDGVHILDVEAAIAALPPELLLPIVNQFVWDRAPAEVASSLRMSRAALRARLAEGLERLATALDLPDPEEE